MAGELWTKGALELATLIAERQVSSREVVQAHLDRIDAVNPALNAVVRVLRDEALTGADAADRAVAAGEPLGRFHGVPVTVKENIDVAGTPTTQGVPMLAEAVSPMDAPLVERARAAGAIPIGRTNLPDLGLRVTTESSLHGATHNPWHPTRTAGGSSGGEASALASGMSPLGFGNDIGGSLRNPATCCGIASIKPTPGVVPAATLIPPQDGGLSAQIMLTDGPMARHVADVRAALEVIAGFHHRDPRSVPLHLVDHTEGRPLKVALMAEPPAGSTHPEVAASVRRAADALAAAGHTVVEAEPTDFARTLDLWRILLGAELRAQMPLLQMVLGEAGQRLLSFGLDQFQQVDLDQMMVAMTDRNRILREWNDFLTDHDVLLLPTWTQPPFELGFDASSRENSDAVFESMRPVMPGNLLGLPAAVVPAGMADGTPTGVQIMGRRFADLTTLRAAAEIEHALGVITPIDPRW